MAFVRTGWCIGMVVGVAGGAMGQSPSPFDPRVRSGTSWQPASTPMAGAHRSDGSWALMLHATATLNYARDPDPRGDRGWFSTSMFMVAAGRAVPGGNLRLRFMASAEPVMGPRGYPLLLQTGESADGVTPLFDRQHPHDLIMEAAVEYRTVLEQDLAAFVYAAPVGEPAIGPPAFMHRWSGRQIPHAPISHHFLDATHVTYGVVTVGVVSRDRLKLEASAFNGREPDEHRWGIEPPRIDSYSARVGVSPGPNWVFHAALADVRAPERLHPGIDVVKLTLAATYNRPLARGNWQSTIAFGRNKNRGTNITVGEARRTFSPAVLDHYLTLAQRGAPPPDDAILRFPARSLRALLVESAWQRGASTVSVRGEYAEKDELFDPADSRHSDVFGVMKLDLGYVHRLVTAGWGDVGLGLVGSVHVVPDRLAPVYGRSPRSVRIFSRWNVR